MTEQNDDLPTKEEVATRLDREIDHLDTEVKATLGTSSREAQAALAGLDRARAIIAAGTERLDEAFYQVGLVKAALGRRQNLKQWAARWGTILLFYALLWLIIFMAGIFFVWEAEALFAGGDPVEVVRAALLPAMVGGIGGALRVVYDLFRRVFIHHSFDPQEVMYYIVQPVIGFFFGAVTYFIVQAGFLVFEGAADFIADNPGRLIPIYVLIALHLGLSFLAGFYQQLLLAMIDKITHRLSPRRQAGADDEDDSPVSVIPQDFSKQQEDKEQNYG